MTAMGMGIVSAAAISLFCGMASAAAISCEGIIPAFRPGVDSYIVRHGARGEWQDGMFAVSVPAKRGFVMDYGRHPGMEPFRGADEIVLATDSDGLGEAVVALTLFEFPHGEKKKRTFYAPLAREVCFNTRLDPAKKYQLGMIGVRRDQNECSPWKIGFSSLRGVFTVTKAEALHVEAETGNPLHIAREGLAEKPVLSIRNAAQEKIAASGVLKVDGFFGDAFDLPVDVALEGGQAVEVPIMLPPHARPKGVWKIGGELTADDGSVAEVDTRFAVMDFHRITPKRPRGSFRLGVHWHFPRFTDEDRRLAAAAIVACGAKLTRADVANMSSIQGKGPDCWDFARTDELLGMLESNGIALDAIIFNTPMWAARPDSRTNSSQRAWAVRLPVAGAFEKFCERLSGRYGTRIDYYEIGNEWDLRFGGRYEEAVELQREAYAGLKRGCPDVCVIPNGWAAAGDVPRVDGKGRSRLHEYFMRHAGKYFDVDTIHCHGAFAQYVNSIRNKLFPLRERTGVSGKPWFSNETALTCVWSERNAALTVWKKIVWAWANGSVDYVWYNLRGSGWNPKDAEQGYGLFTAGFLPRDTYVAFAALSTVVGGARFKRTLFDAGRAYGYEFSRQGSLVVVAWDESALGAEMPVKTDAAGAWRVDLMGNREQLQVVDGKVLMKLGPEPSAVILDHATFVEADTAALNAPDRDAPAISIPRDTPGRKPDFTLDRPEQVYDFFEGNPAGVKRLWSGPADNSAKVWLARESNGLRVRVEVEDDRHSQPYCGETQRQGDGVRIALALPGTAGRFEFGFAHRDDGRPDVRCSVVPGGFKADRAAASVRLETCRAGTVTRYDASIPYAAIPGLTAKTLEEGARFNLIVDDNDGSGRDATIEIVPNAFDSGDMSLAPVIRFR